MSDMKPGGGDTATDEAFFSELAPVAARNLEQHLKNAEAWYPHELVPWSRGRDYKNGEEWDPRENPLPDAVRSALFVNLLTEDNLYYYYEHIHGTFQGYEPFEIWSRRWTAEEGRHAIVIRDYLHVTRALDARALEDARMQQVSGGETPRPPGQLRTVAYVALQELATNISHRNTGKLLADPVGTEIMERVAADESLHYRFYRLLGKAAFECFPSEMMVATAKEVIDFAMPGTGIPGYKDHARLIAKAGIYDLAIHGQSVIKPVLKLWGVFDMDERLTPEAEQAREKLAKHIKRLDIAIKRKAREQKAADNSQTSVA